MNKKYTFENYIVADVNRRAVEHIKFAVYNLGKISPIFLYGVEGTGKTHLLKAAKNCIDCKKYKVLYITGNDFIDDVMNLSDDEINSKYNDLDVLLFDDLDEIERKNKVQRYLLEIVKNLCSNHKQIIVCSKKYDLVMDQRLLASLYIGNVDYLWNEQFEKSLEPVIDKGNELKELHKYLSVNKPLLITPTMDYHKTLWGLSFTNSLLNENMKVRYFSLYDSKDNMFELIEKYHWHLRKNVLESREAKGTFIEGEKNIDVIVEIINTDKPDVVIIDYLTNDDIYNVQRLKYILTELTDASKKNNTAIVIFGGGKSSKRVSNKIQLPDWFIGSDSGDEEEIKEKLKLKAEEEELRNIMENGFYKIISIREANMVQICELLL